MRSSAHFTSVTLASFSLLIFTILGAAGCVTTETHEKVLTELDQTRKKAAADLASKQDALTKVSANLQGTQSDLDKTKQQLVALRQSLEEEQRSRQSAESSVSQLKDKVQQEEKELAELQQRLTGLEQEKAALNKQLGEGQTQIQDLQSKLATESSQASALSDEKQKLLTGMTGVQAEVARLQKRASELEAEASRLAQEREQLRKDQDQLHSALDQERERLKAEEAEKVRLEQERAAKEEEIRRLTKTQDELSKSLQDEIAKGNITIQQVRDRLTINMVDRVLFDSGQAQVKPAGAKVLKQVGDVLKNITDKQIRIEGHTDNVPISTKLQDKFKTNWELSTARATTVVRHLIDHGGVDRQHLSAVGYAETRPIASNDTEDGRASNRRIEIVLYPKDLSEIAGQLKSEPK
jgi:chemotaxis protein MotB